MTINNSLFLVRGKELLGIKKILVVDDERNITDVLATILRSLGYSVSAASDGEEALNILKKEYYELVITDIKMPQMDGLSLLKEINKLKKDIIIIMLTGLATSDTAVEAMRSGAFDYIVKPFNIEKIIDVVARADKEFRKRCESIQLKETASLYHISEAISLGSDLNNIFKIGISAISKEIDADVIALYLKNDKKGLFELKIRGFMSKNESWSKGFIKNIEEDKISSLFKETKTILWYDSGHIEADLFIINGDQLFSMISIPLRVKNKIIGIMNAYSFTKNHIFTEGQKKTLAIFSNSIAGAVETTRLYDNLQQTFKETMLGLVAAIEARDKYTNGHSTRVAEYAKIIAEGLGLPKEDVNLIYQAARLHDIGKIGIDNSALNKPERLTENEYNMFKAHITIGRQIIQPINFLSQAIPFIYYHHEFYNGKGYPDGKMGEDIPLGARILQVADAFDAMTSDRPYRKALPYATALSELRKFSGIQFDPEIVRVFIREFEKKRGISSMAGMEIDVKEASAKPEFF